MILLNLLASVILVLTLVATGVITADPGGTEPPAAPWKVDEHVILADSALAQTLRLLGGGGDAWSPPFGFDLSGSSEVLDDATFGDLVARFAANDDRADRFHVAQRTVLEQLESLTESDLDRVWQARAANPVANLPLDGISNNTVGLYLVHHLLALRSADEAAAAGAAGEAAFRAMLAYEAAAQGFLHDALSSSHMLVPKHDFLPALHATNSRSAHRHYGVEGVYVVNSRGTAYEAFGDGVLSYFSSAFNAVQEASMVSLATVLYVFLRRSGRDVPAALEAALGRQIGAAPTEDHVARWLGSNNGAGYFEDAMIPGLLHIPTPVAATWSIVDPQTGVRTHRPQLAEEGYHDPDLLEHLIDYLPTARSVPPPFRPDNLGSDRDVRAAIDSVKNLASVEFIQDFRVAPSYDGVVFEFGGGVAQSSEEWNPAVSASVGWGIDNFILVEDIGILGGATLISDQPTVFRFTGATNLGAAPLRLELGVGTTTAGIWDTMGLAVGGAVNLLNFDYGFTYAGGRLRLRYDGKVFRGMVHVFTLQVVMR